MQLAPGSGAAIAASGPAGALIPQDGGACIETASDRRHDDDRALYQTKAESRRVRTLMGAQRGCGQAREIDLQGRRRLTSIRTGPTGRNKEQVPEEIQGPATACHLTMAFSY